MAEPVDSWSEQGKPPSLHRRFVFDSYGQTRRFLDALAELSGQVGLHPQNINFGTTYVNVTLDATDGQALGETERGFAAQIDALVRAGR
jgi:pterin-4a-carbinolamine dehydratase